MNTEALSSGGWRRTLQNLRLLFVRPPRTQIAALCHRIGEHGPEVLLITSRNTKRWIIPKGWPLANHSARKTARREAFEEAGIVGKARKMPLGEFRSFKGMGNGLKIKTNIVVYILDVTQQAGEFPEIGQRELRWLSLEDAARQCDEAGLKAILSSRKTKSLLMESK